MIGGAIVGSLAAEDTTATARGAAPETAAVD
jgi:hypothetical protein